MKFADAQFTKTGDVTAIIDGVPWKFPADAASPRYAALVEQGIKIAPYVAPPAPAPEQVRAGLRLSFAQLMIGLVTEKWISQDEGEAWLEGKLPAALVAVIATLPKEHQFPARARALRPSQIDRLDPMVDMLGAAQGVKPDEMDAFFVKYMAV